MISSKTSTPLRAGKTFILCLFLCAASIPSSAQSEKADLIENPGAQIPLDLSFTGMDGKKVTLKEIIDRPTVLTLVYYRCPSICSPLLYEVAENVDECDLEPGKDYRLLTISFDYREGADLAKIAHGEMLNRMDKKIPPDSWQFYTGDKESIKKLTDSVGFHFTFTKDKEDYIHPATVIFLSEEGKITRYLNGLKFLPADMKMALIDASEGRISNVMSKLQRFCYTYDPEGRTYVIKINRIILLGTLFFVAVFGIFLVVRGKVKRKPTGTKE
ncbi:SCO family protein [Acidobacteriota bacterium]